MSDIIDVTAIRELNDQLRQSLAGGVLVITAGVIALGQAHQQKSLEAVAVSFDESNDPCPEHDLAALEVEGERLLFKIDYSTETSWRGRPTRLTSPSRREY